MTSPPETHPAPLPSAVQAQRPWQFINILLGTIAGALIGLPATSSVPQSGRIPLLVLLTLLGMLAGYRRRNSHLFLYLALITILVLATMFVSSLSHLPL